VLLYFGKGTCAWSNREATFIAVRRVRDALARQAAAKGWAFAAVGVAYDRSREVSLAHLANFEFFDEVSAGGGWTNQLVSRYFWGDSPGIAASPEVVVLLRTIGAPETPGVLSLYSIAREQILTRKIGLRELERWGDIGAPVPTPAAPRSQNGETSGWIGSSP
jgi:hypothetical protein